MSVLDLLNWRYAAKAMSGQSVPEEKVELILESIRLSASSIGLQPYKILVITDPELKSKIRPIAFGQGQITASSHLLVFTAWDRVTQERVDEFIKNIAVTRNVPESSLKSLRDYTAGLMQQSPEQNFAWASKQAYIALGTALIAAAEQKVDSTPMEGFNAAELDKLLDLEGLGLKSVALLPLGYRDSANDWAEPLAKVRTPMESLILRDEQLVA